MPKRTSIVCQYLESISRDALNRFQSVIRGYVFGRHGVYALYRRGKLYYVGLASDLRNRLKSHLKDRHAGSWDRFSVYLTIGSGAIRELEALIIRIVRPTGNKQIGRFGRSENLAKRLKKDLRDHHREEMRSLLGDPASVRSAGAERHHETEAGRRVALAAYVTKPMAIRNKYKGRFVRAQVRRDGTIRFAKKVFQSPSMAAAAACGRKTVNGWQFWRYERAPGDWVPLAEIRR